MKNTFSLKMSLSVSVLISLLKTSTRHSRLGILVPS